MKITEIKQSDCLICKVEGEININTSPDLRKALDGYMRQNMKKILIDFAGVSYVDSSGIATLIELLQRIKKIDGKFRLCSMSPKVKNIFEVTKVLKLFEVFANQEAALKDF